MHPHLAFVDPAERDWSEAEGQDPFVGLLHADAMLLERVGREQKPVLEVEAALEAGAGAHATPVRRRP